MAGQAMRCLISSGMNREVRSLLPLSGTLRAAKNFFVETRGVHEVWEAAVRLAILRRRQRQDANEFSFAVIVYPSEKTVFG
jgi:hypothetical protein